MPQSLSQLYAHLVFSTKDRFPFLKDDIRDRVHGYLATVLRDMGSPFVVVGGVEDHVHILFDLGRIHAAKVSPTHRDSVILYIKNQEEHHRKTTFQDEYRDFLNRYGIEFDEQYVWD